jgi:hypothetical protein
MHATYLAYIILPNLITSTNFIETGDYEAIHCANFSSFLLLLPFSQTFPAAPVNKHVLL